MYDWSQQLETTQLASAFQKQSFAELRERVIERHEPYALVSAPIPHEVLATFDIPFMVDVWWSGLVAAKRMSKHYFEFLDRQGYHSGLPKYNALPLATIMDKEHPDPPWGGLPRPAFLVGRLNTSSISRLWSLLAQHFDVPLIALEVPGSTRMYPRWWEMSRWQWEDLYESHRIDFMVAQIRVMIFEIERITGRKFDIDKLRSIMERVNRQAEYLDEVRQIIATAPKCPVRVTEQMTSSMTMQWHRDEEWALNHGRAFRDEVKARAANGIAACPTETYRLMWVGWGLWQNTDFYMAFEQSHGAVFVRSMYLDLAADSYIRYGLADPIRAIASRYASLSEELHTAPWCSEWAVNEAKRYRIDGAIVTLSESKQGAAGGSSLFTVRALEEAGIPVLGLKTDPVDGRSMSESDMRGMLAAFIEERLAPRKSGKQGN